MSKVKTNIKRFNGINVTHYNSDTGEILCKTNGNSSVYIEKTEIKTQSEIDKELQSFGNNNFLKMFRGNGAFMKNKLSNNEIATIVFLSDYICFNDCVLRKNGDARGHALSIRELSDLIGISYDNFRKTMSSLKTKQVIAVHSTGNANNETKWITVNPYIFFRGSRVEHWISEFYKNTITPRTREMSIP
jgi:hypothetical protein